MEGPMTIQFVIAVVLLVGGAFTAWAGPDYGVREDGTPFAPGERPWVRLFGIGLMVCGAVVLVATLLGFRAQPLDDMGAP
jgi:hypothetical protein